MTTYPSHFAQSLAGNHGAMAYLKSSPTYHMNGLALGMSHGLDALQSQSLHYGGGNYSKDLNNGHANNVTIQILVYNIQI